MEKTTIKLRPHHVSVIQSTLLNHADLRDYEENPSNREVQIARKNALENFDLMMKIYQGTAIPALRGIAQSIHENPDLLVEIVEGSDDICGSCVFHNKCSRGDYSDVLASYRQHGFPRSGNPVEADTQIARLKRLRSGEVYPARELFEDYLPSS